MARSTRYPLSLRNVEDLLFDPRHRHLPRDGPTLVEPIWARVRRRYPSKAGSGHASAHALEVLVWTTPDGIDVPD